MKFTPKRDREKLRENNKKKKRQGFALVFKSLTN